MLRAGVKRTVTTELPPAQKSKKAAIAAAVVVAEESLSDDSMDTDEELELNNDQQQNKLSKRKVCRLAGRKALLLRVWSATRCKRAEPSGSVCYGCTLEPTVICACLF